MRRCTWAGAWPTLAPVIRFTQSKLLSQNSVRSLSSINGTVYMCMYGPRHTYVHQMCTARLPAASVCGSHKNHSPSRPVVNRRSLNLYITLLRSRPRGAAIGDRRHEVDLRQLRLCRHHPISPIAAAKEAVARSSRSSATPSFATTTVAAIPATEGDTELFTVDLPECDLSTFAQGGRYD